MNDHLRSALTAYHLEGPISITELSCHGVSRVCSRSGDYLARQAFHNLEPELYGIVERELNAHGIRQGKLIRTPAGANAVEGWWLREWVPGSATDTPNAAAVNAVFQHLAKIDNVLAAVTPPDWLLALDTTFTRVTNSQWLTTNMPGLCHRYLPGAETTVRRGLEILATQPEVPVQLIHGDLGPDNVLMCGAKVLSVIDFTPHVQPVVTSLAGAVYWYGIHPWGRIDETIVKRGLDAYNHSRPLSPLERSALPAAVVKECLRRLATPLALAAESATRHIAVDPRRIAALRDVLASTDLFN